MADATVSRKDTLVTIAQLIEHLRPHAVAVHLIDEKGVLAVVVIAPEA